MPKLRYIYNYYLDRWEEDSKLNMRNRRHPPARKSREEYDLIRSTSKLMVKTKSKFPKNNVLPKPHTLDEVLCCLNLPTSGKTNIYNCAKITRSVYLYFNRRLTLSHEKHIEMLDKNDLVTINLIKMAKLNIKKIQKIQIKYSSGFTLQQTRYMNVVLNTLKKYINLHYYKSIIIALTLRTKFNGQEGVCRLIQSYI